MNKYKTIRLRVELHEKLKELADSKYVSITTLVTSALYSAYGKDLKGKESNGLSEDEQVIADHKQKQLAHRAKMIKKREAEFNSD